nr:DUF1292 domain-containing protein [bacterium]
MDEEQGYGTVVFADEDGEEFELTVLDYFFYNGDEYAVLADHICDDECGHDGEEGCECGCGCGDCEVEIYYMRVVTEGEEETFIPIEDEDLLDALDSAYNSGVDADEEE